MEIDLGGKVVFKVRYDGNTYELNEPTGYDIQSLQKDLKDDSDNIKPFLGFVTKLGMPEDIAKGLGVTKIKKLANGLIGAMDEKK